MEKAAKTTPQYQTWLQKYRQHVPKKFEEQPNLFSFKHVVEEPKRRTGVRVAEDPSLEQHRVQLAKEVFIDDPSIDNSNFIAEEKIDGARLILQVKKDTNRATTRNEIEDKQSPRKGLLNEVTNNVPHFRDADFYSKIGDTILDGEVVAPVAIETREGLQAQQLGSTTSVLNSDPSRSEFLQNKYGNMRYVVFDILRYRGTDLKNLPWHERRKYLERAYSEIKDISPEIKLAEVITKDKKQFFDFISSRGGEGIVLKHKDRPYVADNRGNFLKIKKFTTHDLKITGFEEGKGKYSGQVGAFKVSGFINGKLQEVGSVNIGTDEFRKQVTQDRNSYLGKIVECKANDWSMEGRMRHPRLHRFRPDKSSPEEVVSYLPSGHRVPNVTLSKAWSDLFSQSLFVNTDRPFNFTRFLHILDLDKIDSL